MRSIEYIDAAKRALNTNSDSKLSLHLGLARNTVHFYRAEKAHPSPAVMGRIAELAGLDPDQAILDLKIETDADAALFWRSIKKRLGAAAATVTIASFLAANTAFAAVEQASNKVTSAAQPLYIMANYLLPRLIGHLATKALKILDSKSLFGQPTLAYDPRVSRRTMVTA